MKTRNLNTELRLKQKLITRGKGYPGNIEGKDGDFTIRWISGMGMFFLYKWGNKWYSTRMSVYTPKNSERKQAVIIPDRLPKATGEIGIRDGKIKVRKGNRTKQVISVNNQGRADANVLHFKRANIIDGTTGSITAFANYGSTVAGTVKATDASHGLTTGDSITISGSTNFNGTFAITKIDANNFYFTDTWASTTSETGTWILNMGDNATGDDDFLFENTGHVHLKLYNKAPSASSTYDSFISFARLNPSTNNLSRWVVGYDASSGSFNWVYREASSITTKRSYSSDTPSSTEESNPKMSLTNYGQLTLQGAASTSTTTQLKVDKNYTGTSSSTTRGVYIDYDHTGISALGQTINNIGLDLDINSDSVTHVGVVNNTGLDIDLVAGTSGTQNNYGITVDVDGADTNIGLLINTAGTHIKLEANADTDDYATLAVADTGDLTITTIGDGTTDSDLTLDVDGSLTLDSASGVFIAKNNGTEFSAANSAYAGMILGYTRLEGDLTNQNSYEIQDAFTVEDDTHQITFKTPPSEYVEIELTCFIDIGTTDTEINVGLSSASATSGYSVLSAELEYDGGFGTYYSDDELDDDMLVVKFVCKAAHLADVGLSNTFYLGFSTGGATKTAYLRYGYRATHGKAYPPMIIKATALPATIYDGQ